MGGYVDYYAKLGVLPTAEEIVIRAAYKALAQRYHPDRYAGAKEEAHRRMAEINEAYSILSDANKRSEYDKSCSTESSGDDSIFEEESDNSRSEFDLLHDDWETAVRFYDNLPAIFLRLNKISTRLAYTYKTFLLETKAFENRNKIAIEMEHQFLVSYFGNNDEIIDFARELILNNNKMAAKSLNRAIKVLGDNSSSQVIIARIRDDYGLTPKENAKRHPGQPPDFTEFLSSGWGMFSIAAFIIVVWVMALGLRG